MSDVVEMPERLKDQAMIKYINGFGPQSPGLGSRFSVTIIQPGKVLGRRFCI